MGSPQVQLGPRGGPEWGGDGSSPVVTRVRSLWGRAVPTPFRERTRKLAIGNAFSLVEILVAVALLSFIVLGLVAMFGQTQRALKQSTTDVGLQETGRTVADEIAREMAELKPANVSTAANFYVEIPQPGEAIYASPLLQGLPGTASPPQLRTNYLEPFFFLTHPNQAWPDRSWVATGYYVVPDNPLGNGGNAVGIGTLYRYCATNSVTDPTGATRLVSPTLLYYDFLNSLATLQTNVTFMRGALTHMADGIVHLRVRPFAMNGFPIVSDGSAAQRTLYCTNALFPSNLYYYRLVSQATNHMNLACPDGYDRCLFLSNATPAFVELELGILEAPTYQRYKTLSPANPAAQLAFLSNHVAQVHLFRQRIPIQNVDPSAF